MQTKRVSFSPLSGELMTRSIWGWVISTALWAALPSSPLLAHSAEDEPLLQDYARYNGRCRGGHGDDMETWRACGARDYVGFLLNRRGWCFGTDNQYSFEMEWHRCGAGSNYLIKP